MSRVRLIHRDPQAARRHARPLRSSGHTVDTAPFEGPATVRAIRADPPDVLILDLDRAPSHGRDIGVAMRSAKRTRGIPLVFAGGEPDKVDRVREILPDATFTSWPRIRGAVRSAVARAPSSPVAPSNVLAGYAGTPLPKKLGIKPGAVVVLVGAPDDFERTIGALPDGAVLRRGNRGRRDLTIWFGRSRADVERRVDAMGRAIGDGGLWIAWKKQSSGEGTDLTQAIVRRAGLDCGLVDYKICALDATWSALKFSRRR